MKNRLYLSLLIAILLCLAAWTAHAQMQRSGPARQTWEYKAITFTGSAGDWNHWFEDGKELPLPANGTAKRTELGNQGWELVAVATLEMTVGDSQTYTGQLIQYYKRPK